MSHSSLSTTIASWQVTYSARSKYEPFELFETLNSVHTQKGPEHARLFHFDDCQGPLERGIALPRAPPPCIAPSLVFPTTATTALSRKRKQREEDGDKDYRPSCPSSSLRTRSPKRARHIPIPTTTPIFQVTATATTISSTQPAATDRSGPSNKGKRQLRDTTHLPARPRKRALDGRRSVRVLPPPSAPQSATAGPSGASSSSCKGKRKLEETDTCPLGRPSKRVRDAPSSVPSHPAAVHPPPPPPPPPSSPPPPLPLSPPPPPPPLSTPPPAAMILHLPSVAAVPNALATTTTTPTPISSAAAARLARAAARSNTLCEVCQHRFGRFEDLRRHLNSTRHIETMRTMIIMKGGDEDEDSKVVEVVEAKKISCKYCTILFTRNDARLRHERRAHPALPSISSHSRDPPVSTKMKQLQPRVLL